MISLETAKKLKEAGLNHRLEQGDLCYRPNREIAPMWWSPEFIYGSLDAMLNDWQQAIEEGVVAYFAPRLDQMLAEIEKRGYAYRVTGKWGTEPYKITVIKEKPLLDFNSWGYSPEEATAQVLLWILEQEVTP